MSENAKVIPYSDDEEVKSPGNLQDLIQQLHKIFAEEKVNIEYVQRLMSLFVGSRREWKQFEKFDPHRYTRNLVDSGNGKFNLILLCWGEGQGSSIHSHAGSHCFMKVLAGDLKEEMYGWPKDGSDHEMKPFKETCCKTGEVVYINDDLGLHRIENTNHSEPAVSLHLYSPPFDECKCFDQKTGHSATSKVTFWSKYGERTPYMPNGSEPSMPADCLVEYEPENN